MILGKHSDCPIQSPEHMKALCQLAVVAEASLPVVPLTKSHPLSLVPLKLPRLVIHNYHCHLLGIYLGQVRQGSGHSPCIISANPHKTPGGGYFYPMHKWGHSQFLTEASGKFSQLKTLGGTARPGSVCQGWDRVGNKTQVCYRSAVG